MHASIQGLTRARVCPSAGATYTHRKFELQRAFQIKAPSVQSVAQDMSSDVGPVEEAAEIAMEADEGEEGEEDAALFHHADHELIDTQSVSTLVWPTVPLFARLFGLAPPAPLVVKVHEPVTQPWWLDPPRDRLDNATKPSSVRYKECEAAVALCKDADACKENKAMAQRCERKCGKGARFWVRTDPVCMECNRMQRPPSISYKCNRSGVLCRQGHAACVRARTRDGTGALKWLSMWDENQYRAHEYVGWGNFGFSSNFTAIHEAAALGLRTLLKVSPMFWERTNGAHSMLRLRDDYLEQWEMMYPTIRELYRNGTIFGFVLGDELVWSGVEWPMVETAASLLRHDFPGSVIWLNEANGVVVSGCNHYRICTNWTKVPDAITWFSLDRYWTSGTAKDHVARVKDIYRKHVSPRLQPHQSVVLVPGAFASHYNKKCSFECYDGFCLHDAIEYLQWALDDPRVAAITPYHWHLCPHCHATRNEIGVIGMNSTRAMWRLIGRQIVKSSGMLLTGLPPDEQVAGREEDAWMLDVPVEKLLKAAKIVADRAKREAHAQASTSTPQQHELQQMSTKTKAMQMVGRSSQEQLQALRGMPAARGRPQTAGAAKASGGVGGGGGGGGGVGQKTKNKAQQATKEKQKQSQSPAPSPSSSATDEVRDESGQGHVVMQRHVPRREVPVQAVAAEVPIAVPDHQAEGGLRGDQRAEELECADSECVHLVIAHRMGQGGIEQQLEEESIQLEEESTQIEEHEDVEEESTQIEEQEDVEEELDEEKMSLSVATWNIAAVNNNPFEYWVTHDSPSYNSLMEGVQGFLDAPGDNDLPISQVFTDSMATELWSLMEAEGWEGVAETKAQWASNFAPRTMVAGFMKDKAIGAKRLASMPDRITNTINTADGGQVCRPTVINVYAGKMDTVEEWWEQWKAFMFSTPVTIKGKAGQESTVKPCQMLDPIKQAKYPAITPEEEKISIPLQTLCQAIFDAVLVHMMNVVSPGTWHGLKLDLCNALVKNKDTITLQILANSYAKTDMVFLQEVAGVFVERAAGTTVGEKWHVLAPAKLDSKRDQNSMLLLSKAKFPDVASVREVTADVCAGFDKSVPVADGDVFAVTVTDKSGHKYLLVSFHGDTDGLATVPVTAAVRATHKLLGDEYTLVFGLDANAYKAPAAGKQLGYAEFITFYEEAGLGSCWGAAPDVDKMLTTFNARTYLQPQLNKAVKMSEKHLKGDVNPKDYILFAANQLKARSVFKDNTGKRKYTEGMVFPTLAFPSDHGILGATLEPQSSDKTEL